MNTTSRATEQMVKEQLDKITTELASLKRFMDEVRLVDSITEPFTINYRETLSNTIFGPKIGIKMATITRSKVIAAPHCFIYKYG